MNASRRPIKPDRPAHALVVRRPFPPRAFEQKSDGADGHDKSDKDGKARSSFGASDYHR